MNDLVAEALGLKGMDFIENKNIIYSNLATDGLHLNNGVYVDFQATSVVL